MKINRSLVFVLFFSVLLIISCSKDSDEIKIGGAFPLSGFAAGWGEVEKNGVILAIEEFNQKEGVGGRKINFIVEDFSSEQAKAVTAVQKLINVDNVKFIIGPTWLDTFGGVAPLSDEYKVVMITPSASIDAIKSEKDFKYVFSTWYRTEEEIKTLVRYLSKIGNKKLVLFLGNDPFWIDIGDKLKKAASENNIEIEEFKITGSELDFRTLILKLKEMKASAVFFGLNNEISGAAFLKQIKELYPEIVLYTTEYIGEFAAKEDYRVIVENIYFVAPEDVNQNFITKYKNSFGTTSLFSASNSYDATNMVLEAIRNGKTTPEEVKDYLKTTEFDTVTFGKVRFDDIGGLKGGKFVINVIKNGQIEKVE